MEQTKSPSNKDDQIKKTTREDVKLMLQQCLNDPKLEVVNCSASKLLSAGENYSSIMLKIDALVRNSSTLKEESLNAVAKTPSCHENIPSMWPEQFRKEVFMYEKLFPMYREIEREAGIEERELINSFPKLLGYRNSLTDGDAIDGDSVLLMENLKVKHFYNRDWREGLDEEHAKKALIALARFHALGISMKQKRAFFAEKAIEQASHVGADFSQLDGGLNSVYKTCRKIPCMQKHWTVIEAAFERAKGGKCWKELPKEPWATIIHGDFWSNNILFQKNDAGQVDDVKFVDFAFHLYHNPLIDLPNFLTTCIDISTQRCNLVELLQLYYNTFIEMLRRTNCDISPFTRKSFNDELKKLAVDEFPYCALWSKFRANRTFDEAKSNDENFNNIMYAEPTEAFINKLLLLNETYERMKWF